MIRLSVLYPYAAGARFDMDYYRDKHMPLLAARLGEACHSYTIDKGLAGGAPGSTPTYLAMAHVICPSTEAFQSAFGPHADEILGDIPNYTDVPVVMQFSEVVV